MQRRAMPDIKEGNVNVTPLIDIVMCLIIFFMLVAKIGVYTGADPKIDIPATVLGTDLKEQMGSTLVLNVREGVGEQPMVTGLVPGSSREPVEIKVLEMATGKRPLLEVLRQLRYGPDGVRGTKDDNPNFQVIIRGEKAMRYSYLEPVLWTVTEAGVKAVNFTTKQVREVVQVK